MRPRQAKARARRRQASPESRFPERLWKTRAAQGAAPVDLREVPAAAEILHRSRRAQELIALKRPIYGLRVTDPIGVVTLWQAREDPQVRQALRQLRLSPHLAAARLLKISSPEDGRLIEELFMAGTLGQGHLSLGRRKYPHCPLLQVQLLWHTPAGTALPTRAPRRRPDSAQPRGERGVPRIPGIDRITEELSASWPDPLAWLGPVRLEHGDYVAHNLPKAQLAAAVVSTDAQLRQAALNEIVNRRWHSGRLWVDQHAGARGGHNKLINHERFITPGGLSVAQSVHLIHQWRRVTRAYQAYQDHQTGTRASDAQSQHYRAAFERQVRRAQVQSEELSDADRWMVASSADLPSALHPCLLPMSPGIRRYAADQARLLMAQQWARQLTGGPLSREQTDALKQAVWAGWMHLSQEELDDLKVMLKSAGDIDSMVLKAASALLAGEAVFATVESLATRTGLDANRLRQLRNLVHLVRPGLLDRPPQGA